MAGEDRTVREFEATVRVRVTGVNEDDARDRLGALVRTYFVTEQLREIDPATGQGVLPGAPVPAPAGDGE